MKIKFSNLDIYKLLIFALMFDAYAIFYINTFPVTVFTVVSVVYVIEVMIKHGSSFTKVTKHNTILIVFLAYLFFNFCFFGFKNFTAFIQIVYFVMLALLSYRVERVEKCEHYINFFQLLMTIMAVYGIYQFLGRIFGLPFTDLTIPGHMVKGYNWSNTTPIFGINAHRSNAIFREPSYFAQMLTFSILMFIPQLLQKKKVNKKQVIQIFVQAVALLLTLSGTGLFLLGISTVLFIFYCRKNKRTWWRIMLFIPIGVIAFAYIIFFTSVGDYLLNRLNELFVYSADASSGFVRFRSWIEVVRDSWGKNFLLGSGVGTGSSYISKYASLYHGMTLNGFAKIATELGAIGIVLLETYLIGFINNKNINSQYLMLAIAIIVFMFMQEASSSNIFWCFVMLLNCKTITVVKE